VDGDDTGLAAAQGPLHGDGRRHRGLAHAAGAGTDDDLPVQGRLEAHVWLIVSSMASASRSSSLAAKPSPKRKGRSMTDAVPSSASINRCRFCCWMARLSR